MVETPLINHSLFNIININRITKYDVCLNVAENGRFHKTISELVVGLINL
jgi:hypothetical protein